MKGEAAPPAVPARDELLATLTELLRAFLLDQGTEPPPDLGEQTQLVGPEAVLSSLGLVSLIVDIEQTIEERWGLSLALADERAMSRRHSPFRTVGTLADYIVELARDG